MCLTDFLFGDYLSSAAQIEPATKQDLFKIIN
jgi:hypothetical protein